MFHGEPAMTGVNDFKFSKEVHMRIWVVSAMSSILALGAVGCDKSKPELDKCRIDLTKVQGELTAAKGELDAAKQQVADLTTRFEQVNKEREALLVRVTQLEAAQQPPAEVPPAAEKKPAAKKPAAKKEEPAPAPAQGPKVPPTLKGKF